MIFFLHSAKLKAPYLVLPVYTNHQTRARGIDSAEHRHPVYHLIFITEGKGFFQGKARHPIQKMDLIFIAPLEKHIFSATSPSLRYFAFTFYLLSAKRFLGKGGGELATLLNGKYHFSLEAETRDFHKMFGLSGPVMHLGSNQWRSAERLIERYSESVLPIIQNIEIPDYLGDYYSPEEYAFYLRESVHFLADITALLAPLPGVRTAQAQNPIIQSIKSRIETAVHEKYSLKKLADGFGYTPQHLAAFFRQKTGETIGHYTLRQKIRRACDYLRESSRSLTEISRMLDFSSSQHFSTAFRKIKGTSPNQYRKAMR